MRRGRKPNHYIGPDGNPVTGLARLPSGRWRVIGTNVRFTEPDEARAIARYSELTRASEKPAPPEELPSREGAPIGDIIRGFSFVGGIVGGLTPEQRMFRWFAEQIRYSPQRVAELTGIERIAYLDRLPKPETLPTLDALETLWKTKATCSPGQRRKVLRAWQDFRKTTGIASIRDISGPVRVAFQDAVYARNLSPKEQAHIFAGAKRVLNFAKDRHIAPAEIGEAIAHLRTLKPSEEETEGVEPHPISVADWRKLLAAAEGRDRAQVLVMLNGAYYSGEIPDIKWQHIRDGAIFNNRKKRGKYRRVCTLWAETLAAINALPRISAQVFTTRLRLPLTAGGAHDAFNALADKAKVPHVTGSQLRDGAASAAADAQVSSVAIDTLLGHSSGMKDKYVKRTAETVRPACDAIYRRYMAAK